MLLPVLLLLLPLLLCICTAAMPLLIPNQPAQYVEH